MGTDADGASSEGTSLAGATRLARGRATGGGGQIGRVVEGLGGRMDAGAPGIGGRLPSIRETARAFAVSKNTAVAAYERLVVSGRVESRPGSGFYVAGRRPPPAPAPPPAALEAVDSIWLLREQLDRHYEVRVGDGRPPSTWMEDSEVGRHLASAAWAVRRVTDDYGNPYGYRPLRQRLASMLAERAIAVDADRILLTSGANHALDLIVRHLVSPGDSVLVDEPGYYPLFGKLRLARARLVGVRRGIDGPDVADLVAKAAATGARLLFTQSLAQNPTGCSLSLPVAYRLLQAATAAGLTIVESDPFGDVMAPAIPRLAALDQLERVIYVGTVAKTLSAGLRTGFVTGAPTLVEALRDLKMVTCVNSSGFVERALHELIDSGQYRRHLRRLAARIEAASLEGRAVVHRLGLPLFGEPAGGFYAWCGLPEGTDVLALSRRAAARGILIAPGDIFHPNGTAEHPWTRLNVAYLADPRFERFMRDELAGRA